MAGRADAIGDLQPLPVEHFSVNGAEAFVITAEHTAAGRPWVWYAPTLKPYPNNRVHGWYFKRLADAGISIAGIDIGEVRGSPGSTEKFTAFYNEMVRRGFSTKPILLGQSRGGLMMLTWGVRNPDKVTAFAGIYPVCNLTSWPLKQSKAATLTDYGMTEAELNEHLVEYNPIDNLQGLIAQQIPFFIVHGSADYVVPYTENGQLLKERYEAGGGTVSVKMIEGKGHQTDPHFFECVELLSFILKQAKRMDQ